MSKRPDIDIDVKDRPLAVEGLEFVPASLLVDGDLRRHNTGMFFQRIPVDPVSGLAAFPSGREAEDLAGEMGFYKIDVLPNHAYRLVDSAEHRDRLLAAEPDWRLFERRDVVEHLYQLGNQFDVVEAYPPHSIEDLACILAIIRPGKRHLLGEGWDRIRTEAWLPAADGSYAFKKSHAVAFAMAIVVQLNSMVEKGEIW